MNKLMWATPTSKFSEAVNVWTSDQYIETIVGALKEK